MGESSTHDLFRAPCAALDYLSAVDEFMGIHEGASVYGGQLTIRSAPGEGTEVVVRLR
jgi:hypothetical protein